MDETTYVEDEEELYRSVRGKLEDDEYTFNDDGKLIITYKAFQDREKEPSVDKADLNNHDPSTSKKGEGDGIVSLTTKNVRSIIGVETKNAPATEKGKTIEKNISHAADVIHKPVDDNHSHSIVTVNPSFIGSNNKQSKAFKLLRKSLARLATNNGWTLEPK